MLRIEGPYGPSREGKVRWESTRQAITSDKKSSGDRNGNFGTSEKKVPAELLGLPSS
jgi:hypothetical protein